MEISLFIVGVTQVLKMAGLSSKWLPAVAVLVGAAVSAAAVLTSSVDVIAQEAIKGAWIGMVSTGIVDLAKGELEKLGLNKK